MMTEEQRRARTLELTERVAHFGPDPETLAEIEALHEGNLPDPQPEEPPPVARQSPSGNGGPPPDGDLFSAADLDSFAFPAERFRMPNGKWVWVHALSAADGLYLGRQIAREIARAGTTAENEKNGEAFIRGKLWQALLACRTGESATSPRVFRPEDVEKLRKSAGWYEAVLKIADLSDRMGAGEQPEREALRSFFSHADRFLQTWCTRLTADSWEAARQDLERFGSCVSRVNSRGSLIAADAELLAALMEE